MERISEHIEKAKSFSEYYNANVYDHLKVISNEITNEIKQCLEKRSKDFKLVISNSVYDKIELYEFSNRVKNPVSLEDNLIRKNEIFQLVEMYDLSRSQGQSDELNKFFYKIDDIIGVKITTSLYTDCENVFKLLQTHLSELKDISLRLDGDIPSTMRNGRRIYKIKGVYKAVYSFELQIKSKIDSAWGDLEHNIFYKDYDFNYIKKNNKEIMNNLGALLEKIEDIMLGIRNGKMEFSNEYRKLNFIQEMSQSYMHFVEKTYKSKYLLDANMDRLFDLYEHCTNREYEIGDMLLNGEIQSPNYVQNGHPLFVNYLSLKNYNFEISLFEIIHWSWVKTLPEYPDDLTKLESLIRGSIDWLLKRVSITSKKELIGDEIIDVILNVLKQNTITFSKSNLLLDTKSITKFVELIIAISLLKEQILERTFTGYQDLDEDNIQKFIDHMFYILFCQIYVSGQSFRLDNDQRFFISELSKIINANLPNDKDYKEVVIQTNDLLLNILGGEIIGAV